MSHVSDCKLRVRDLDAMDETLAVRFPHLELRRGQKTHAWWGRFEGDSTPPQGRDPKDYGKCEHAIGRKGFKPRNGSTGEYEIGLVPALDGDGYDLLLDTYGPGRVLQNEMTKLRQEYAYTVAEREVKKTLAKKGWTTQRVALANGRLNLKLQKR